MLRRDAFMLALLPVLAAAPARAAQMSAPDVVVYCDSTLAPALQTAGADFRRRTGVPVRVFTTPGPQSLALIAHGARNDVIVTQSNWMQEAAEKGQIKPATRIGAWRDPVVLAGREGASTQTALPAAASLSGLLAGAKLGVVDPTQAGGPDGVALAGRLGWKAALAGAIDGPGVAFLIRRESAGLGLLPRSSAVARPSLAVIATVPDAIDPAVEYAAAASKNVLSSYTQAFLDYLKTPDATTILQNAGLETAR